MLFLKFRDRSYSTICYNTVKMMYRDWFIEVSTDSDRFTFLGNRSILQYENKLRVQKLKYPIQISVAEFEHIRMNII